MTTVWKIEFGRLAGVVAAALLSAMLTGFWALSFLAGLTLYIIWHLRQMRRLERWLSSGGSLSTAPDAGGVWEQLVNQVHRLNQRNRRRKKRLSDIVNRFHRSTEAMPDAAVVLRDGGVIEWSNRAARDLLGVRNPQDHGQRIGNLLREPSFRDYLTRGDFDEPLDITSPVDPELELNLRIVGYGDGQYLLMARDISSLRRIEAIRRDFVANVSHELRTPLTVVTGYLESFDGEELPEHVREGVGAIDRQSRRMLSIVEDLLT
ncbi:MAG: phosphate regulon sensor protein PhoR, partial [Halofilum sp. (in: g-proteobacteria)]